MNNNRLNIPILPIGIGTFASKSGRPLPEVPMKKYRMYWLSVLKNYSTCAEESEEHQVLKEATRKIWNVFFLTLVWPSIDLLWVMFPGHTFFDSLSGSLVLATSQEKFDLGRSLKIGYMRVTPNSRKFFLKNKLGSLLNISVLLGRWIEFV